MNLVQILKIKTLPCRTILSSNSRFLAVLFRYVQANDKPKDGNKIPDNDC